ncbi:hypothetical protein [Acidovorax sp.]|uniref:hypothetical protein n=1 Tax=Acidovorax sp. TaxID=1872122 RepID=UPI00391FA058
MQKQCADTLSSATGKDLKPGDRVQWTNIPRHQWMFGPVAQAVVRKLGAKRVQIEVRFKAPYTRPARWESRLKWVPADSLQRRVVPSAAFGEEMRIESGGFVLTGWRHPNGRGVVFKDGIWYGAVDGMTCTAPWMSEEQALASALHALYEGAYRTTLRSSISTYEHWLANVSSPASRQEALAKLPELRARLQKLDAAFPQPAAQESEHA